MKKCSNIKHKEIDAILFCSLCKIYMCNKCEKFHSELYENTHQNKIIKDIKELDENFSGICNEDNHINELIYFCRDHNKLCCAECITKIKAKNNGKHKDCNLCLIEDIEKEKKSKLKENIKCLEDLSKTFEKSIKDLKKLYEKINEDKEKLKVNIQNIFTKLRNEINKREDKLLLEVDNKFDTLYFKEDIIKQCDNLPNKIKISLNKGKLIDEHWNKNKLNFLINDCLNIENNIKKINIINESVKKYNSNNFLIKFEEEGITQLLENVKNFGIIKHKIFDSIIEFDEYLVKSWLNNRNFKTELLFRKSRDGSSPYDFHNKCDNKGITIVFIETTKGYKFGGYTELQWDKSKNGKTDKSTFIFSFNHKEKYNSRNNNSSIYCSSKEGPRFGSGYPEIYLYGTLDKGQSYDNSSYNTFLLGRKLTNGEEFWDVKELEVHKIIYI